jgi:hypothetical protein
MAAIDRILSRLSGVRDRGGRRWISRCPAHDDHSPSLTICQLHDRFLIHCHAGCVVADVCAAIGITLADLYHDRRHKPDPLVLRRRNAADKLECWRQEEIRRCAEDLRIRDTIIRLIDRAVRDGVLTMDDALISLEHEYRGYSDVEYRLDRFVRGENVLALWWESRRTA